MAAVEQLRERILYRLSLDMQVRTLIERLLLRFFRFPNATTSYALDASHSAGDVSSHAACHVAAGLTKRTEITERTELKVISCSFRQYVDEMLPEMNFPATLDEIVGRQVHSKSFRVVLRHCETKGRIAFFARHGDSGIDESSRLLKLAVTCADANYEKLPVAVSILNDISD